MTQFSVSRAIVTGAAQGIGAQIAEKLASDGLHVAILDRNGEAANLTAKDIAGRTGSQVIGREADVTDHDALAHTLEQVANEFGGIDTVVANAGITRDRMFHKLTPQDWSDVISVNLTGVFNTIHTAAPWLRTQEPARVVLISSMVAKTGNLGQMNYVAAKSGIDGLVRSAALELARFGTTVNGVRPGFIRTAMTDAMPQASRDAMIQAIPLGRAGETADIAAAVSFLLSDSASFITGQLLDVNGGAAL